MFQNISFSFLCALAFISWSVLCYLHFIEEHKKHEDYIVEIYTENSQPTHLPRYYPYVVKPPNFISRVYELLIGYGVVLATTVVLSKVLQFIEIETITYLQRIGEIKSAIPLNDFQSARIMSGNELDLSLQGSKVLKEQLNDLQVRCQELLEALSTGEDDISYNGELAIHPSNSSLSDSSSDNLNTHDNEMNVLCNSNASGNSATQCSSGIDSPSMRQIVYVTHSHIHINFNAPVTLSQPNVNTEMLYSARVHRGSEFLQVWSKYIKDSNERPMLTGFNNFLL